MSPNIVFCLPGKQFSHHFLTGWSDLLISAGKTGFNPIMMTAYNPNIYKVRNLCLMGKPQLGSKQLPFRGSIDYQYIMWIDSDMVFTAGQFQALWRQMDTRPEIHILSALCLKNQDEYAVGRLAKSPKGPVTLKPLTPKDLKGETRLLKVDYAGLAFMLVRKGVFEALGYPWFYPITFSNHGHPVDFITEDIGFCLNTRQHGFNVYVDPAVKVGHEKSLILE